MKRVLSILLLLVMVVTSYAPTLVSAAEEIKLPTFLSTETTDDNSSDTTDDGDGTQTVTRAEWLQSLVETFDYSIEGGVVIDDYYTDLDPTAEYYKAVMTAVYYGLIDILPNEPLRPDEDATREFAAFTLNKCMGYLLDEGAEYTYLEKETVTYPDDIQIAINRGWFELVDGAFLPEQAVTVAEQTVMLADARDYVASLQLDPTHNNQYTFLEDVIVINSAAEVTAGEENTEIKIENCSKTVESGNKFVIYQQGFAIPYRALSVMTDGTTTTITATELDFADAIESMDVQLSMDTLPTNFYTAEDTELIFIEETTGEAYASAEAALYAMRTQSWSVVIPKFTTKYKLNDAVSLSLSVELKKSKICADIDIGWTSADCSVWLDTDVEINGKLSCDFGELYASPVEIYVGGYEIPGVGGLSLYFKVDITGSVSVVQKYHLKAGIGVGVDLAKMKTTKNKIFEIKEKSSSLNAEISAKIYLEAKFGLYGKATPFQGYFYAETGFESKVSYTTYREITGNCMHFAAFLYAEYGAKVEWTILGFENSLDWKQEPINEDNSPVKISCHYEDGSLVSGCTRKELNGTTTGSNSKIGDSGYTTKSNSSYAGSGLSSGGSSSGFNSSGEPVVIYSYSLDKDGNATITNYKGNAVTLTIPQYLDGHPVIAIGEGAFRNNLGIQTIIMQDNILTIGSYAFERCTTLRNVILSEKLTTIGHCAFSTCKSLTTIDIPDTVTKLDSGAFMECTALQSVKLSRGLTTMGAHAFYNCDALTSINIPKSLEKTTDAYIYAAAYGYVLGPFYGCDNLGNVTFEEGTSIIANGLFANCPGIEKIVIPNTVTAIKANAFEYCKNLTEVTLPSALALIDSCAFGGCTQLTSIDIPDTVTKIDSGAFMNCTALQSVKLSKGLATMGAHAFYNCDALTSIEIPKSLEKTTDAYISSAAYGYVLGPFYGCDNLGNVTFEEGTSIIANGLFANCPGIEKIVIPNTVTAIKANAFEYCKNLTEVTLPSALTSIDSCAFGGCTQLTSIDIPDTVTKIDSGAFMNCTALQSVKLSKGLTTMGAHAFYNCDALTSIEIPKSLEKTTDAYIYAAAYGYVYGPFYGCDNLGNVTFEEGISIIANGLFANCPGIESIAIPDTVTVIKDQGFFNCVNLQEAAIPQSVTEIQSNAFKQTGLQSVTIPDSVAKIGTSVFAGCVSLTAVTWSANLPTVTEATFEGCIALTEVVLPNTVTTIDHRAFKNCDALTALCLPMALTKIQNEVFYDCDALTSITIPYGVTSIGNSVFYDCDALETVEMPNTVTSMGTNVFYHCDVLKNVTLSQYLTKIPSGTFQNCAELEEIVIPYYATSIDANAFNSSSKLSKVVTRDKLATINSTAFSYPEVTVFYGNAGSYTETWASENGYTFNTNTSAATSAILNETVLSIAKGKTATLILSIDPADFADTISFKSSNTNVVTVDENGKITAVGVGTATIKVYVGDASASCKITVTQAVTRLKINKTTLSLNVPETYQLTVTITPDDASNKTLLWTSSDEKVATVDENGLVTAIGNGKVTITATTTDGSNLSVSCTVTVIDPNNIPVSGITLNKTTVSLDALDTYQLTATVKPTDAANKGIIWTSSDENVATVDENGVITAIAKGTATITATAADGYGASATCTVTVSNTAIIVTDATQLESAHPYPNNCKDLWFYQVEGAKRLVVLFDEQTVMEDGFDYLHVYDGAGNLIGTYTGEELSGKAVEVEGNSVKIRIDSDDTGNDWGFKVAFVQVIRCVHSYQATVTEPTCTESGYTTYVCSECGDMYTDNVTEPYGHTEHIETVEPTCTADGFEAKTCAVCGIKLSDTVLPALGHDIESHGAKEPSCTEIGWDAYETCTRCDYTTYIELPATGHSYVDGVCSACGELECIYGDVNGDGKIGGTDATRLLRYLAFFDPLTGGSSLEITAGADTNGDGKINGMDVTRLLRYLAFFDPVTGESSMTLGPTA